MDPDKRYTEASRKTADSLKNIAQSPNIQDLSRLSLPEIEAVVDQVARVIPAGNVPGVILSGLARLSEHRLHLDTVRRDVDLLFKGVELVLDTAVYSAFFAGPAAVIWGYQNLLKLVGKGPDDAFPEGAWQFYVDYALREDTARHANETCGFDSLLNQHRLRLSVVDRITAWIMAAIHCLHQYEALLENEWRERVYTYLLRQVTADEPDAAGYARLYRDWEKQRPYGRDPDCTPSETYPAYRRRKFDHFLAEATAGLRPELGRQWRQKVEAAEAQQLPAFQQQMSILAYLDPGPYGEKRTPLPLRQAHVGLIYQGRYYLIPACSAGGEQPLDVTAVRRQIATLIAYPADIPPARLTGLVGLKRAALAGLRQKVNQALLDELDTLRLAPILLNYEPRSPHLPLSELRQAERGIGDHALTMFDTGDTIIFDQSHIFFDGAWGAALAEILTNEALSWAVYLTTLPPARAGRLRPYAPAFQFQADEQELIRQAPPITPEVGAETEAVDIEAILNLRKLFKQRNDLIELTVNDLLVLYRAIHAVTYQPNPDLMATLESLAQAETTQPAAQAALSAIEDSRQINPAVVIPVDASQRNPRDRLYPMTFEAPLNELDLPHLRRQVMAALIAYQKAGGDRSQLYANFNRLQRRYLATLAGFGVMLSKAKEYALTGQSASTGTIKLLAYMPPLIQRMLDKVPGSVDILNDIIKGREVFSNVGAVAPSSTLTRFITAKDDNDKKTLAWGVITDATGVMRITLRDFRPHVGLLAAIGRKDLAVQMVQDYLDGYARDLNHFISDLERITQARRQTQPKKSERTNG